jgi:hypothetical protein
VSQYFQRRFQTLPKINSYGTVLAPPRRVPVVDDDKGVRLMFARNDEEESLEDRDTTLTPRPSTSLPMAEQPTIS